MKSLVVCMGSYISPDDLKNWKAGIINHAILTKRVLFFFICLDLRSSFAACSIFSPYSSAAISVLMTVLFDMFVLEMVTVSTDGVIRSSVIFSVSWSMGTSERVAKAIWSECSKSSNMETISHLFEPLFDLLILLDRYAILMMLMNLPNFPRMKFRPTALF